MSISGPLTGATAVHLFGLHETHTYQWSIVHLLGIFLYIFFRLQVHYPFLKGLYDFRMNQWKCQLKNGWYFSHNHPIYTTGDAVFHSLHPVVRMKENQKLPHMDKVFLLSIVTNPTGPSLRKVSKWILTMVFLCLIGYENWTLIASYSALEGFVVWGYFLLFLAFVGGMYLLHQLSLANLPVFTGLSWYIARETMRLLPFVEGFPIKKWLVNDGVVNIESMKYPWYPSSRDESIVAEGFPIKPCVPGACLCKSSFNQVGKWYVHYTPKNHLCGTFFDRSAGDMYRSIFHLLNQTERAEKKAENGPTLETVLTELDALETQKCA